MSDTPKAPAPVAYTPETSESGADPGVDMDAILAKFQPQIAAVKDAGLPGIIAGAPAAPAPAAAAPPAPTAAPVVAPGVDPVTPAPVAGDGEAPPLRARQLAALARQEMEVRQLKEQYEAKLKELDRPAAPAGPQSLEELRQLAFTNPEAAVKALGIDDPTGFASQLFYGALGDDAPPELKREIADRRRDAEVAALKAQISRRDEEAKNSLLMAQRAAQVAATDRELHSFAKAVPAELNFLAAEARTNADAVYEGMCTIAASFIEAGKYPSAREVAQLLNEQMATDYARLHAAAQPPAPAPAPTPAPQIPASPMGTLSDADTRGRAPVSTTPVNPDAPDQWLERAKAVAEASGYRWG